MACTGAAAEAGRAAALATDPAALASAAHPASRSPQAAAPRGGQAATAAGPADAYLQTQPTTYMSRLGVADAEITPAMSSQLDADADQARTGAPGGCCGSCRPACAGSQ